jgi:hypothetical protein
MLPPSGRWELLVTTPLDGAESNVTFLDFTGNVKEVAGTREAIVGHGSNALRVAVPPRDPTLLLVRWGAAICNRTPTIALHPLTPELLVASLDPGPGRAGCDAASIDFGVKVQLAAPVAVGSIVATDRGLEAQSWGALLVGDSGGTRGVTVDDRTALIVGVRPIDASGQPPGPNGISVSSQLDPRALEVVWSADACPLDMRIDLANSPGGGLDLRIVVPRGGDDPCDDRPVTYGLALQLVVPVVASDVTGSLED